MSNYKGMRWLKCDLQMQTPADSLHWSGDRMVEGQEAEVARVFAEACYSKKLDVVGITDHNFLSKDFLPYLKTAFHDIEQEFEHKITLFLGFEFEADVGIGIHVLCLFEPDTDLDDIDHILTECGVERPRINGGRLAKSTKRLPQILSTVQKQNSDGKCRGIVIIPHVFEDSLFDNDRISEWLQQEEFKNPDLLAVEVPKPIEQMSDNFQKLFRSGEDCLPDWKRVRSIAKLMSSDNKKLIETDEAGNPTPNSIGYRYSWIKMSQPSIESLRQAFLDHESRIILPEDVTSDKHPSERTNQARIQSISIRNVAFLADQEIFFSRNMNCVIGGRGSGKSTLLEYLRILFGRDQMGDIDSDTKERIKRIRDTLNTDSELKVNWISADGVKDQIIWRNDRIEVLNREDLPDPITFFKNLPIRFYSQQQLNRLTESKLEDGSVRQAQRLLDLVDGFNKRELDILSDQERTQKQLIQDAFEKLRRANNLEVDLNRLKQEHQELDRQWKARSEIQEEATKHQRLKSESRYLDEVFETSVNNFSEIAELAENTAASHTSFSVEGSPHEVWFQQLDIKVKAAKDELATKVRNSVEEFKRDIERLKTTDSEWEQINSTLEQADIKFREACKLKGLTTDDVGRLEEISQLRSQKLEAIDNVTTQIKSLKEVAGNPNELIEQLHQIWENQYKKRVQAADIANKLAVLGEGPQRFIEVTAKYQQDKRNFREVWQRFAPSDGRTRLGRNWENVGEIIYSQFIEDENAKSPWELLTNGLSNSVLDGSDSIELVPDLLQHIEENQESWENLRCTRIQDAMDMKLFRADGTLAGSIADGSLSDGQRNTAALALLLAQEGGPLVIDQPEDELDSNFVFRELIPMLRKVKMKRQLIMSTHNANLPVNGDAELVYAFEAHNSRGEVLAQGGLDQENVTKAVLDIMEGTEEAFRRRREKYHF